MWDRSSRPFKRSAWKHARVGSHALGWLPMVWFGRADIHLRAAGRFAPTVSLLQILFISERLGGCPNTKPPTDISLGFALPSFVRNWEASTFPWVLWKIRHACITWITSAFYPLIVWLITNVQVNFPIYTNNLWLTRKCRPRKFEYITVFVGHNMLIIMLFRIV